VPTKLSVWDDSSFGSALSLSSPHHTQLLNFNKYQLTAKSGSWNLVLGEDYGSFSLCDTPALAPSAQCGTEGRSLGSSLVSSGVDLSPHGPCKGDMQGSSLFSTLPSRQTLPPISTAEL
jgi:hypothetical protein